MQERRKVPRYRSKLEAQLSQAGEDWKVSVWTMSIYGSFVEGTNLPAPGQKCLLSLEWEESQLRLDAEVVWRDKKGREGLKFLSLEDTQLQTLKRICTTLPMEPLGRPSPPDKAEKPDLT